jgi:uncharacterized protein (DUF2164 family)
MSSGTDRFFEEMLDAAKRTARKDVAIELRNAKQARAKSDKANIKLTNELHSYRSKNKNKETALDKREKVVKQREQDVMLAKKEIKHLNNQINKVKAMTMKDFISSSKTNYYYGGSAKSIKAKALTKVSK